MSEFTISSFFTFLNPIQPHTLTLAHFDTGTLLWKAAQCDDVLTAINANQDDRSGLPGLEVTEIIWQKCNAGMKNWRWLIQRRLLSVSMSKPTIFSQPILKCSLSDRNSLCSNTVVKLVDNKCIWGRVKIKIKEKPISFIGWVGPPKCAQKHLNYGSVDLTVVSLKTIPIWPPALASPLFLALPSYNFNW